MSESWSGKFDQVKSRIKEAVANTEGEIDLDQAVTRIRAAVTQAGADVDTDALRARVREAAGKAEEKVDTEKLRQWIDEVDRDKLKGWLNDARTMTASAAAAVETHGEKLVERTPGAVDKLIGAAKEKIGDFTGNEDLAHQGELQTLKGDIEERFAAAAETGEAVTTDAATGIKTKSASKPEGS